MKAITSVGLLGAVLLCSTALATPAEKEDAVPATVVSSIVKNVGSPGCVDGQQVQMRALVLTLKDASGASKEVEYSRWQESSGNPCSTAGPKKAPASEMALKKEAKTTSEKTKGGPCDCWRRNYYTGNGCYYIRHYDCDYNWCWTSGPYCY